MRILTLILSIFVISYGCGERKTESNAAKNGLSVELDSTYLFDGKTLNGWEITNFGPQGPVEVSGGRVVLGMGEGCTGITYKKEFPVINYEVTLEAMRINGNDFFCGMTFPAGKNPCTLIIGGWGGNVVGLSSLNGKDASENETTKLMKFEKGQWYAIKLQVTDSTIKAWINNELTVNLDYLGLRLSIRPEVNLSRPFGIASWYTTSALRNIRVVKIQ
jgi:hypothetical protein